FETILFVPRPGSRTETRESSPNSRLVHEPADLQLERLLWRPLCAMMAEREGFEPPDPCGSTVFKTAALNHSATSPKFDLVQEAPIPGAPTGSIFPEHQLLPQGTQSFRRIAF